MLNPSETAISATTVTTAAILGISLSFHVVCRRRQIVRSIHHGQEGASKEAVEATYKLPHIEGNVGWAKCSGLYVIGDARRLSRGVTVESIRQVALHKTVAKPLSFQRVDAAHRTILATFLKRVLVCRQVLSRPAPARSRRAEPRTNATRRRRPSRESARGASRRKA